MPHDMYKIQLMVEQHLLTNPDVVPYFCVILVWHCRQVSTHFCFF